MKKKLLFSINSILVFLLIILLNVKFFASDENFYYKEFEKYGVYGTLEGYEVNAIHRETLDFLLMKKNSLPVDFFSERESRHLNDVRSIFKAIDFLLFLSVSLACLSVFFLYCIFKEIKKPLYWLSLSALTGAVMVLAFSLFLFLIVGLDFGWGFGKFHSFFFEEGSYLFNPATEKIVLLYPEGLFFDAGTGIAINSMLSSLVLIAAGIFGSVLFNRE